MSTSNTRKNKAAARSAMTSYRLNPAKVIALLHSKIVWTQYAPKRYYPFGGTRKGIDAVARNFRRIGDAYKIDSWKVVDAMAEGSKVWSIVDGQFTERKGRRKVKIKIASQWTFKDGKVIRYSEFFDTASALIQERLIKPAK
jgi:ketosteroid isomerase-like protein